MSSVLDHADLAGPNGCRPATACMSTGCTSAHIAGGRSGCRPGSEHRRVRRSPRSTRTETPPAASVRSSSSWPPPATRPTSLSSSCPAGELLAPDETVVFADILSASLLEHLLEVEGGAVDCQSRQGLRVSAVEGPLPFLWLACGNGRPGLSRANKKPFPRAAPMRHFVWVRI